MLLNILLICCALGASAAPAAVCSSNPYSLFLPLANYPLAQSYCSSRFPVAAKTTTAIALATATQVVLTTQIIASTAQAVSTVVVTQTSTITDPVSVQAQSTETDVSTAVSTETTTVTTTAAAVVQRRQDAKRAIIDGNTIFKLAPPTTTALDKRNVNAISLSKLLASLATKAASVFSTGCSCIETPKTVTTTLTQTSTVKSTSTVLSTSLATTTSPTTQLSTIQATVFSTTTITELLTTATTTTSITTTTTTTTVTPSPTCLVGGDAGDGSFACTYDVYCQTIASSPDQIAVPNSAATLRDCITACDNDIDCFAVNFDHTVNTCTLLHAPNGVYNENGDVSTTANLDVDSAVIDFNSNC